MKHALIVSFSPVASDPRVMRQVRSLGRRFCLVVAGYGKAPQEVEDFIALTPPQGGLSAARAARVARLLARRFDAYYWNLRHVTEARAALGGRHFDLVVVNDVQALPLAIDLAKRAAIVLDAHEFSPREFEDRLLWRTVHGPYNEHLCRHYLGRIHAMTTVAGGIADAYRTCYGVSAEVVHSAPAHWDVRPSASDGNRIRMVHHGAAAPSRRIECMLEVMDLLDERFALDLMLVPGDVRYIRKLRQLAEPRKNVRVLPPVPMQQIVPFTNRYDIGLFLLPPTNFNYAHALPNKFFEFIQARLAVAIGPSPEMKRLVEQYDCGIVAEDFAPRSLARLLLALTPERLQELKANADRAARELCFEKAEPVFLAAVERAMRAA